MEQMELDIMQVIQPQIELNARNVGTLDQILKTHDDRIKKLEAQIK